PPWPPALLTAIQGVPAGLGRRHQLQIQSPESHRYHGEQQQQPEAPPQQLDRAQGHLPAAHAPRAGIPRLRGSFARLSRTAEPGSSSPSVHSTPLLVAGPPPPSLPPFLPPSLPPRLLLHPAWEALLGAHRLLRSLASVRALYLACEHYLTPYLSRLRLRLRLGPAPRHRWALPPRD
uniref:Uncharacterized protein n=1 Tax=Cricetulus griseus TaxID=10029 RepID=A0A8C2L8Q0_CRIGR